MSDPIALATLANVALLGLLYAMQALTRVTAVGWSYGLANRDDRVDEGVLSRRVEMVKDNQIEALAVWIALFMLTSFVELEREVLSNVSVTFCAARIVYALVSLAGVPVARSIAWVIGFGAQAYLGYFVGVSL